MIVAAAVVVGTFAVGMVFVFGTAWVGIHVHDFFSPERHVDPITAEICWVDDQGPNGLETVRGPRSDMPTRGQAVEIPCA